MLREVSTAHRQLIHLVSPHGLLMYEVRSHVCLQDHEEPHIENFSAHICNVGM
jgi:hypothetical protein